MERTIRIQFDYKRSDGEDLEIPYDVSEAIESEIWRHIVRERKEGFTSWIGATTEIEDVEYTFNWSFRYE